MIVESETMSTEEWHRERVTVKIETPIMRATIRIRWISKRRISVIRGVVTPSIFRCNDLLGISLIVSRILRRLNRLSVEIWVERLVRAEPRIVIKWRTVWTGSVAITLCCLFVKSVVVGAGIESRKSVIEGVVIRR